MAPAEIVDPGRPPCAGFPMIRQIGRQQRPGRRTRLHPHRNPGIEICAIRNGRYDWEVEGCPYHLGPGDGFVTLPWQAHGSSEVGGQRGALDFVVIGLDRCPARGPWAWGDWCLLDAEARRFVADRLRGNPSALLSQAQGLGACFDRLWCELHERQPGHRGQVHACLGELLLRVARLADRPATAETVDPLVEGALRQIAAQLDEPWDLAAMAAAAGLGRSRFSERVADRTGLSPKRWLVRQRLERARHLLRSSRQSITTIAMALGYPSSQYFATCFKRDSGMAPGAWRWRHTQGGMGEPGDATRG